MAKRIYLNLAHMSENAKKVYTDDNARFIVEKIKDAIV